MFHAEVFQVGGGRRGFFGSSSPCSIMGGWTRGFPGPPMAAAPFSRSGGNEGFWPAAAAAVEPVIAGSEFDLTRFLRALILGFSADATLMAALGDEGAASLAEAARPVSMPSSFSLAAAAAVE